MIKVETKTEGKYLYTGAFGLSDSNKVVSFHTNERVELNIQNAVSSFENVVSKISIDDLKQIFQHHKINLYQYHDQF